jgi:hypothetical protein
MTRDTIKPDQRIAHYVAELEGPLPVVSRSHLTLRALYCAYGPDLINDLLDQHWAACREASTQTDEENQP